MTMSKQDIIDATSELHRDGCYVEVGPRGGLTYHVQAWRKSGQFQPRPRAEDWFQPVKHGMYDSMHVTEHQARVFHAGSTCGLTCGSYYGAWLPYMRSGEHTGPTFAYLSCDVMQRSGKYAVGYFDHGKLVETRQTGLAWQDAHAECRRLTDLASGDPARVVAAAAH